MSSNVQAIQEDTNASGFKWPSHVIEWIDEVGLEFERTRVSNNAGGTLNCLGTFLFFFVLTDRQGKSCRFPLVLCMQVQVQHPQPQCQFSEAHCNPCIYEVI